MSKKNTVTGNDTNIYSEGSTLTGKYIPAPRNDGTQGNRNTKP